MAVLYKVYITEHFGVRNHIRLFVEMNPAEGSGRIFHVVGTILQGMEYETRPTGRPNDSPTLIPDSATLIGTVDATLMDQFEAVCQEIPPPAAQVHLNGKPKDPSQPLRRCGDWVQEVKAKLLADGILQTNNAVA